jgi:hypothetical protein
MGAGSVECQTRCRWIGLGLTPLDLAINSHNDFLALWLLPMPLLAVVLTIENLSHPILRLAYGLMAGCISIGLIMYASAGTVRGYAEDRCWNRAGMVPDDLLARILFRNRHCLRTRAIVVRSCG